MSTKPDSDGEGNEERHSEVSNNQSNQKGSSGDPKYVTVEEFMKLNQTLEAMRRSLQSEKDKGVKRLEGEVGELKQILQSYRGKSTDEILQDLEEQEEREARQAVIEMARGFREGRFPERESRQDSQKGVDVAGVLKELELDDSDTRVQAFRSRAFQSETEAYREAAKLVKQINTTRPDEADQPSITNKRLSASSQEELRKEYDRRSEKLYGPALLKLKKEMREKGLEIS